ncbi:MAG: SDR family oxidoreductase [Anaerolineae bacterium]|nr:SDR family oxidoreductase [Anaerolineae bacterium]
MQLDLSEQVALVTGAAHRVGKKIVVALAQEGVHILVNYNRADDDVVRDTLRDIKSYGVDAYAVQADISQPEGVEATMEALKTNFGKVHILVNSASVFPGGDLLDVSLDSWNLAMNVNLRAPFLFTQQAAKLMTENDPVGGVIVNICDQGADAPWPERPHHGISKAALWMLTQVSAVSLGPYIRVNAIVPGPIMKPPAMTDEQWAKMGEPLPLKTTGSGEDVGRAVVYLAKEPFITGTKLQVNGGEHLHYPRHDYD